MRTEVTGLCGRKQDEQTIRPDAKLLFVAEAARKSQADGVGSGSGATHRFATLR
jgi:hypothetical protein